MAKQKKYTPCTSGLILVMRQHANGSYFIGTSNRMFAFDPNSASQCHRFCLLYNIGEESLTKLIQEARLHPGEFAFMTL